jgi:hypothetical protein
VVLNPAIPKNKFPRGNEWTLHLRPSLKHRNPDRRLAKSMSRMYLSAASRKSACDAGFRLYSSVPLAGLIAQSVEQRPFKALVLGSSPSQPIFLLFAWPGSTFCGVLVDVTTLVRPKTRSSIGATSSRKDAYYPEVSPTVGSGRHFLSSLNSPHLIKNKGVVRTLPPRVRSLRAVPMNVPLARPHATASGVAESARSCSWTWKPARGMKAGWNRAEQGCR